MAALFGTSAATDNWLMASVVPNLLFNTINTALSNVIVPVMAGHPGPVTSGERIFVREVIGTVGIASLVLSLAGEVFAPGLLRLLAPGFGPTAIADTVTLTRIMMPTIALWSLVGIVTGVLQAKGIYAPTAAAPVIVNIVRIGTILTLGLDYGIDGVAWGFLLSVGSQCLYLVPALRSQGFSLRPRMRISNPLTRQALRLTPPLLVMTSAGTIGLIVDRILASSLPTGTIAALNYSLLVMQLPVGLLIAPLVLPGFTRLSEEWNTQRLDQFRGVLAQGMHLTTILIIPALIFLVVERGPVITLLYQRGAFTVHSTIMTAHLVIYWAVALPAFAWGALLNKAAFALKHTTPILIIGVITMAVNVVADLLLVHPMGGAGLALGTALASWTSTTMTWTYLWRRIAPGGKYELWYGVTRIFQYAPLTIVLLFLAILLRRIGLTSASGNTWLVVTHVTVAGLIVLGGWCGALAVQNRWRRE